MTQAWDVTPWMQPMEQAVSIMKAHGCALVQWPSGRRTLEQFAWIAVMSDVEAMMAYNVEALKAVYRENLDHSMRDFQTRYPRHGYLLRQRRRIKPRRVVSVEWVKPSEYRGPAPMRGGVLP